MFTVKDAKMSAVPSIEKIIKAIDIISNYRCTFLLSILQTLFYYKPGCTFLLSILGQMQKLVLFLLKNKQKRSISS